ncbi:MAG TPA: hypothetical protein VII92_14090 [Anaerolineae bacterium]
MFDEPVTPAAAIAPRPGQCAADRTRTIGAVVLQSAYSKKKLITAQVYDQIGSPAFELTGDRQNRAAVQSQHARENARWINFSF